MSTKSHSKLAVQVDDFAKLQMPKSLALSPDGKLLAYTRSWIDGEKKKYFANLHVAETSSGKSRQWTFGDHSDRSPVWSRDGKQLAFLRFEKGEDRIYLFSRDGGAPELLFKKRGGISSVQWAENDSSLIVKFRHADPDKEAEKAIADGKEPKSETPAVRKVDRLFYRLDGDGFLPEDRYHLYQLNLATKKFRQLTRGKADDGAYDVSPDGNTVAYVANTHRDPDPHPYHVGIFLLNLKTGKSKQIRMTGGDFSAVSFSPNGKYLVYLGHHNMKDAWGVEPVHPWRVDLKTGARKNLTPGFDRQPHDATIGDIGFDFSEPRVSWSKDSKYIFYPVSDQGDCYIVKTSSNGGKPERVWKQPGQVPLYSMANDSIALIHADNSNLGDIHFSSSFASKQPKFKKLISHNRDYIASRKFSKIQEVWYKSTDGVKVHGWLAFPPDFSPAKKYPAIINVHGGPRTQYGRVFVHEMHYFAAQGFVVFYPNPRGSQGYGKEFAGCIVAAWGTKDYDDVMAAVDYLEQQKYIDKKSIGITGGSYGGYMTNICLGRSRRFKAGVTQRSVVDLKTFAGTSDIGFADQFEFGGYYWENPEGYEKMSPLTYAHNIKDPLLIIHSEMDLRCAMEQAEQLYAALKIRGRTTELLRFPEEFHGMSRNGRPDRRIIRLEAIVNWFKKYIKK